MAGTKTLRYENKNMDLKELGQNISQFLESERFGVQSKMIPNGFLIQAQKGWILSNIIDAERALTILLEGDPNNFTIKIGIGKFIKNLVVMAAEAILLSSLFLFVDVPEILWTEHVEKGIIKKIEAMVPRFHFYQDDL